MPQNLSNDVEGARPASILGTSAIAGIAVLTPLLVWLGRSTLWLASSAVEFAPQLIVSCLALSVVLIALSQRLLGVSFLAAGFAFAVVLLNMDATAKPHDQAAIQSAIRAVSVNALTANPRPESIVKWVEDTAPDLVVVVEATPAINRALDALDNAYPFRTGTLRTSFESPGFVVAGITILSKLPIIDHGVLEPIGREDRPLAWAKVRGPAGDFLVGGMHPPPPRLKLIEDRTNYLARGMHLLTEIANGLPVLALGDFNATPWSPAFATRPADWRIYSPGAPTWPRKLGFAGIPIDLAALHGSFSYVSSEVGPDVGSDHAPVLWQVAPTGRQAL